MKSQAEWLNRLHLCSHISGLFGAEGHIDAKKGSKQHSVVKPPGEAGGARGRRLCSLPLPISAARTKHVGPYS